MARCRRCADSKKVEGIGMIPIECPECVADNVGSLKGAYEGKPLNSFGNNEEPNLEAPVKLKSSGNAGQFVKTLNRSQRAKAALKVGA